MFRSRTTAAGLVTAQLLLLTGTVAARDKPVITYIANPGNIDIFWEHDHRGADKYVVRRNLPDITWVYETDAKTHPDRNLTPDTEYKYQVCAVYGKDEECSGWLAIRTLKSPGAVAEHPKPAPRIVRSEAYHEPPSIRIWWEKTGSYDRVIVRWRHQERKASQADVDTGASGRYL